MDEHTGEHAFKLHESIVQNGRIRRGLLYTVAADLKEMKDSGLYKSILGDDKADFKAYLSQIEVYYSRAKIHTLLRIFTRFTEVLNVYPIEYDDIPQSRLIDILPIVTKENYKEWLSKARVLLSKDWKIEVRTAKGQMTEEDDHTHDFETYERCKICGGKNTNHGISQHEANTT